MAQDRQMWERQKGESKKAFFCFKDYYLTLPNSKRSLSQAYRDYLTEITNNLGENAKYTPEDIQNKLPNGTWQRWYRGQNGKGEKVLPSWKERAEALDRWREGVLEQVKRETKFHLWEKEVEHYKDILYAWEHTFSMLASELHKEPEERRGVSFFSQELRRLIEAREKVSDFIRKTVDLPSEIKRQEFVRVEYESPDFKDQEGNLDIGIGMDDLEELDDWESRLNRLEGGDDGNN